MSFSDLKVKRIETSADTLTVEIMDGRVLSVPLAYYPHSCTRPRLSGKTASPSARATASNGRRWTTI